MQEKLNVKICPINDLPLPRIMKVALRYDEICKGSFYSTEVYILKKETWFQLRSNKVWDIFPHNQMLKTLTWFYQRTPYHHNHPQLEVKSRTYFLYHKTFNLNYHKLKKKLKINSITMINIVKSINRSQDFVFKLSHICLLLSTTQNSPNRYDFIAGASFN